MSSSQEEVPLLEITLDHKNLRVSYLSSLLRAVQATLREVARSNEVTSQLFAQQTQPIFQLSTDVTEGDLILSFAFTSRSGELKVPQLATHTFDQFFNQFERFIKNLPQKGLWGDTVGTTRRQRHASEVTKRLGHLRVELSRFPRARLEFKHHTIDFHGDRMEIR